MNKVILIGRLAKDPEISYTSTGSGICKFTLVVDGMKDKHGEKHTDFIRVTVFGAQGENCERYLSKGRQAGVEGRIVTGSYPDKNGKTIYTTDVVADRVEFLGGKENP